jgi:hypothetical protein
VNDFGGTPEKALLVDQICPHSTNQIMIGIMTGTIVNNVRMIAK